MNQQKTPEWREFERLVARIEGALRPAGARVRSPDKIPELRTGKLREVDATIRSSVGTAPILITVECRRRKVKQDTTWIEQLASLHKRRSLQLGQVFVWDIFTLARDVRG